MTTTTATTVLGGLPHPGTPLRLLQSRHGFFLGFLTQPEEGQEIGRFLSRESVHFATQQEAAFQLDLLQAGAVPFRFFVLPAGVPKSTRVIMKLLTAGGGQPVRQDTEASPDFVAPRVDEDLTPAEPTPVVDDSFIVGILRTRADELGLAWNEDMSQHDLARLVEAAEAQNEADGHVDLETVTPPGDTEDDDPAPMPGELT